MNLVLLLLCSAFVDSVLISSGLREFIPGVQRKNRRDALEECKAKNSTLVTVYDDDDVNIIEKLIELKIFPKVWLGLHIRGNKTTWSDGAQITFNNSTVTVTNGEQQCEAIVHDKWQGFNCSERKHFMCYKNGSSDPYKLIELNMNWCEARRYCRRHFTDLVSISNQIQNQKVIEKGKKGNFWIGLLHDEWEWENDECSTFREWERPTRRVCTTMLFWSNSRKLFGGSCRDTAHVLCSKGNMRIKVIKERLNWEEAFDYCEAKHTELLFIYNETEQRAVAQWLNYTVLDHDPGPFWLSLRQSRIFGFWVWTSNRLLEYSYWKNDTEPARPFSSHCGAIDRKDYRWTDKDCRLKLPFLCAEQV